MFEPLLIIGGLWQYNYVSHRRDVLRMYEPVIQTGGVFHQIGLTYAIPKEILDYFSNSQELNFATQFHNTEPYHNDNSLVLGTPIGPYFSFHYGALGYYYEKDWIPEYAGAFNQALEMVRLLELTQP